MQGEKKETRGKNQTIEILCNGARCSINKKILEHNRYVTYNRKRIYP